MKIHELIEKLNACCKENNIYTVAVDNEIWNILNKFKFDYVASVDREEHRWYVLALRVFKVVLDNETYYIGTWEAETLKNECMSISDCEHLLEFFEMEQYTTVSYRAKK